MSVRKLLIAAPGLCGARHAEKHAEIAAMVFDFEKEGKGFPRRSGESAANRISFLFDWPCDDEDKRLYCKQLAALAVAAHYKHEHDDKGQDATIDSLSASLASQEPAYSDVSAILTVEQAATMGFWY